VPEFISLSILPIADNVPLRIPYLLVPLMATVACAGVFVGLTLGSGTMAKVVGLAAGTVVVNVGASAVVLAVHFWQRKVIKKELDAESSADETSSDEGSDDLYVPYRGPYEQRMKSSRPEDVGSV
jgi:hypothetical protein